jgi:cytochrome P450
MRDPEALCEQLLNVFFAGRDTPAVALGNVFFCVARHPLAWSNIREETKGLRADELSFEKLKGLRYISTQSMEVRQG